MFDIGFWELFLVAVIGLIVLGPERLPHTVRMAGAWIGRIRRSILDAQYEITRQLELEELKQRLLKIEQEKDHENNETIIHPVNDEEKNLDDNTNNVLHEPNNDSRIDDLNNERSGTSR
ncbi:MAG: Sec-independent protein translocase protein TatB [Pseudomonadota bacterium]